MLYIFLFYWHHTSSSGSGRWNEHICYDVRSSNAYIWRFLIRHLQSQSKHVPISFSISIASSHFLPVCVRMWACLVRCCVYLYRVWIKSICTHGADWWGIFSKCSEIRLRGLIDNNETRIFFLFFFASLSHYMSSCFQFSNFSFIGFFSILSVICIHQSSTLVLFELNFQ